MKRAPSAASHAAGLSLVELLISLVIGLVLMLGVTQIFMASRAASQLSEGVARTQENARFALEFLERDIRMAGHMGCVNDQAHLVRAQDSVKVNIAGVKSGDGSPMDFSVPIQGYEAQGTAPGNKLTLGASWGAAGSTPSAITNLKPKPLGGSDIIVMRYLAPEGSPVLSIGSGTSPDITIASDAAARLSAGAVTTPSAFAVADCSKVDVFAGKFAGSTITASKADLSAYSANNAVTMVYRVESMAYYVATNTAGEPALYRARGAGDNTFATGEELVEGIESLQFLYGQDTETAISSTAPPTGVIAFQKTASGVSTGTDAAAVAAWRRVGLVQFGLLVRSPQRAAAEQANTAVAQLGVLGVGFNPPTTYDDRYRASYEVSVALRNRLFGN
ncbi:type IV pilus assembly protein PilW [Stenotrophomonas maltophilia]|uniref:PilW family protein n=1 Tax=Stenotrophomonas maltophilia TaxID=40324 RepID=UPI00161D569E|nr:PilW family protein [Stenotrophomonas maltophilia]MBB5530518.1 type IV pilus assembly protein PilW [Stenotrophomonas maltophilia]HEL5320754.1 PilW family protein [Stenotrophomonas maltophilia]